MAALRTTWLSALPGARLAAGLLVAALTAGLALSRPPLARAAECAWRHPGKPSRLFLDDRVAVLRRYYDPQWTACAAPNGGRVSVEWRVGSDAQAPPVETDTIELRRGRSDTPFRLEAQLFPNHICEKRSGPPGKRSITGLPGEERVSELVPVRARVVATGALAALAFDAPPIEVPCPACDMSRGKRTLRVQQDYDGNLTLEAELDAGWFECARQGATLMLLGYAEKKDAKGEARNAVKPQLLLRDLQQELTRKGDVMVLRKPLPKRRLCAQGETWAFEFWGRGELARASGGGRTMFTLRCDR
jgi:hypothetical protein